MENIILFCLTAVLSLWLVLTIFIQFDGDVSHSIQKFDKLSLLPRWTFFAPKPGDTDVHLLCRFWKNDSPGEWMEVQLTKRNSGPTWHMKSVWNPNRRIEKLLFDFSNDITYCRNKQLDETHLTEYIQILALVETLREDVEQTHVQFMIAGSNKTIFPEIQVYFTSPKHPLDDNCN